MLSFGKRIRKMRAERGLSMEKLAKMAGVSATTLSCIENEKNETTIRTACGLANALGVSLDELVGREPGEKYCL